MVLPIMGPTIGAMPCVTASTENANNIFADGKESVITALEITTGAQPKNACKNLATYINSTEGDTIHIKVATLKANSENKMGFFLPTASLTTPQKAALPQSRPKNQKIIIQLN